MEIRPEQPTDIAAISQIITAAFATAPHSGGNEARIVETLRAAGALTVSLVALDRREIVGHAAFSPVAIADIRQGWYGLGPVAVRPDKQGRGFGQSLVQAGIAQLRALRAAGCVVLGDPRYYRRFGFADDPALTYGGQSSPYFQRLILGGPPASGDAVYHSAFSA